LLSQLVAHPVALAHPAGAGVEVRALEYSQPGRHEAFWDGTDQSGRQVASGIYLLQLTVNGQSGTRKMIVQK
jgi:flagellar hook assembly protein FlgD